MKSSLYLNYNNSDIISELKSFINTTSSSDSERYTLSNNHIRILKNLVVRKIIDDLEDLNWLTKKINHYLNSNSTVRNIDTK